MKKIFTSMIIISLIVSISFTVYAADFDYKFAENYTMTSIVQMRSPARSSTGNDDYVAVNSKTNQPRTSGTNPHGGTDLSMSQGRAVYATYYGKIIAIKNDSSTMSNQLGRCLLQLDINNDKVLDNYYITFLHIVPDASKLNTWVKPEDIIATIDSYKIYPPHLHFNRSSSSIDSIDNQITYKLYNFYRSISSWSGGEDLDFISGKYYSTAESKLYITGYTRDNGSYEDLSKIEVYYKIGSSGTWSSTPKYMIKYNSFGRWYFDFKTIAGASGKTVYFYLAGIRADIVSPNYNWGLFPMYYRHPGQTPTSFGSNSIISDSVYVGY